MSNWVIRSPVEYFPEASPATMKDLFPAETWIDGSGNAITNPTAVFNPDLTAVAGQPVKYWKMNGDLVELMTAGEQTAVDDAEEQVQIDDIANQFDVTGFFDRTSLKAMGLTLNEVFNGIIDELNEINIAAATGRPTIAQHTNAKLKNRFKVHLGV